MIDGASPVTRNRSLTRHYQTVDLASRTDGASPHELVALLYAELGMALDVMSKASPFADTTRFTAQYERAASILHTLEASLDPVGGGVLALRLGAIYRQMRKRLATARSGDAGAIAEVREGLASLADAWAKITA